MVIYRFLGKFWPPFSGEVLFNWWDGGVLSPPPSLTGGLAWKAGGGGGEVNIMYALPAS